MFFVQVPYEITLLSNAWLKELPADEVWVPYEITLLSNAHWISVLKCLVWVPYEITLLSNWEIRYTATMRSLSPLWNYTTLKPTLALFRSCIEFEFLMKLHYSQTGWQCLPSGSPVWVPYEITLLSNVCASACVHAIVWVPYEITLLSNYARIFVGSSPFESLMKLHYSQTIIS